ncbi:MAG: hypothetical protein ABFC55_05470 [Tenuifilaceae bacterium]
MTKKEQLLLAISMLDEGDCEFMLKILSEETRKDSEIQICEHRFKLIGAISNIGVFECELCHDKMTKQIWQSPYFALNVLFTQLIYNIRICKI